MEEKDKIIQDLKNHIKQNPEQYPFIAQFWDINIQDNISNNNFITFGHFGTKSYHSYPFYKPFSKIIDFSKIDD
jgi:hypothetical protein